MQLPAPRARFLVKTKVVVRHLPPGLSEDALVATLVPYLGQYDYVAFYPGRILRYAGAPRPPVRRPANCQC